MPHNKKNQMKSNKMGNNKRGRRSGHRPGVGPGAFTMGPPASKKVRLVYSAGKALVESAAGLGGFNFYRLNSVYDVDTAFGSTATPGFAEWSAFYSNYRVWSVAVRAEIVVGGLTGIPTSATVCLVPNPLQATLPSSATSWPVQPGALHKTLVNNTSGGTNLAVLQKRYSLPKLFRVTQSQFINDFDYSATTSSNPARQGYLALTVQGLNSSTGAALSAQMYFSFEVEFFNPILLAS
jgi:hypothetical protein